jgi:propanol-preferring alcohol dehydrogenase
MTDISNAINRAIVYAEPGTTKTEVVELPIEQPGPGQVLVRLFVGLNNSAIQIALIIL